MESNLTEFSEQDLSIIIAWGSSTGYTEEVAQALHGRLSDVADSIVDIGDATLDDVMKYDVIVIGVPTWHEGERLDRWSAQLRGELAALRQPSLAAVAS